MSRTSRQQRRRSITIASNLVPMYHAVCDYYGIHNSDATTVFNLCLHTVGKALAQQLESEMSTHEVKGEISDGRNETATDTSSGTSGA